MPELPEVETMCRGVAGVTGSEIVAVTKPRCRYRPIAIAPAFPRFVEQTVGRTIAGVSRLGKRVVLELDSRDRIVIEPRMTGLVLVAEPPNTIHLRLRLELNGGDHAELLFWDRRGLGTVRLYSAPQFAAAISLGPDALAISVDELRARLNATRRPVKVALLDQRIVAGVGNLYASEILHLARIHPAIPGSELSRVAAARLHLCMRQVLEEAILHEGSTLSDGTYRNALNQSGGYQQHHRVYDRQGEPCSTCRRTSILRLVQAQRSTFFCPRCQKLPEIRRGPAGNIGRKPDSR